MPHARLEMPSRRRPPGPRTGCVSSCAFSPHTEQQLHRQLIEPLVAEPFRLSAELRDQCLNLRVGVPLFRTLVKNQIRAHAPTREVANAVVVFRAVRMRVEMTWPLVPHVLEEFHQP